MEKILKYFPGLSAIQRERLARLFSLYREWNEKINVVSRKDIDMLYLHHVLHSLAIARVISFRDGSLILDAGTGGGFPGIPLAIMFPGTSFHLVDSIGKKIRVVGEIAGALELQNVTATKARVEDLGQQYDFVVSRAVKSLDVFYPWVRDRIKGENNHGLPNGILYLKGGDLSRETRTLDCKSRIYPLSDFFEEDYFQTKYLIHLYN
jgi:16S rRNA (guanine527-N7)-methyltransferase